jgi:endonuclease/exonuclease/phosphatase family metal-dependent hydrolase
MFRTMRRPTSSRHRLGTPEVRRFFDTSVRSTDAPRRAERPAGTLRVLSLNVAHGRADGRHQLLQSSRHRDRTLSRIAAVFERERPDVVGLQEADGPSFWSGGFCHVEALARRSGFAFAAHGAHVERRGLSYGTGLLSRLELEDALACTFDPSLPTPPKGFTVATTRVDDTMIDVVSVHLDFLRASVRKRQVARMVEVLAPRRRPLVVMGDFNAGWRDETSAVQHLASSLQLVAHAPHDPMHTFPAYGSRLDWILVSRELAFDRHEVLPDVVSDHLPVVADVRLR